MMVSEVRDEINIGNIAYKARTLVGRAGCCFRHNVHHQLFRFHAYVQRRALAGLLPFYGILMLLCGLVAGIVGGPAVIRQHERSWLVWLTLLPGLLVLLLLLGEFLYPH
jgi:hypothetical protein